MSPNQTPDLASREEDESDDDAETVQMGGRELDEMLSQFRVPKEEAADWLNQAGLARTPSDSLAVHRSEAPVPLPVPPPESEVARWPWLLAGLAVALLAGVAAIAVR